MIVHQKSKISRFGPYHLQIKPKIYFLATIWNESNCKKIVFCINNLTAITFLFMLIVELINETMKLMTYNAKMIK